MSLKMMKLAQSHCHRQPQGKTHSTQLHIRITPQQEAKVGFSRPRIPPKLLPNLEQKYNKMKSVNKTDRTTHRSQNLPWMGCSGSTRK